MKECITALRCHADPDYSSCSQCPYTEYLDCFGKALRDTIKYIEELEAKPQGEWIPVSERLPEYSGWYLISLDDIVTAVNFTGTYFMSKGGNRIEVDAWQPVPEPYMKGGTQ